MIVNKKLLKDIYVRLIRLMCGVNKQKVVFSSFSGKSYSDNPKAVSEALHEINPDAQIFWIMADPEVKKHKIPSYVRCIDSADRMGILKHLATASVLVSNFSLYEVAKSKKQLFIQTWHGDKAFKKVLYDSPFVDSSFHVSEEIPGYCDLAVAGSEYGKRQYETAFRYQGEIMMQGTPRNDRLVQKDPVLRRQYRDALNVQDGTKVLLYAPTLRREASNSRQKQQIQNLDIPLTLDHLEKKCKCKWVCLLRAHPAVIGLSGVVNDDRIKDVSQYEDMADLMLASDLLITDYSSCAGDFALLDRPVVLFQSDRQEYIEKDRSFYFDIEDSPYMVADSQEQLNGIIDTMTEESAVDNCRAILKFYGDCETGHAAESVAQFISKWMNR